MGLPVQQRSEFVLIHVSATPKAFVFTIATDVIKLVASILPVVALFQVFDGLSGVSGGILRARGKQVRLHTFPLAQYRLDICVG